MVPSSISIHVVEGAPNNSCRQCLCPQGEPPPASLGDSPRPAGRSGPGSCQITAFALGPGVCEILCEPFKSKVSISPNPLGLLKLSLTGLQSQMLWGFILTWGSVLSRLWENLCNAIILQFVGHSPRAMGLDYVMGSSYSSCRGSFFMSLVVEHFVFWWVLVFFINGCSADSCDFGVSIRGELKVFLFGQSSITTGPGTIAAAVVSAPQAAQRSVKTAPHLAFSFFYQCFSQNVCYFSADCPLISDIHIFMYKVQLYHAFT